ncbi:fimbrial protein [[Enterobacter] lignolyticus]|uniref:Fimbrial protein n=1 Tax=[Enterobacter] lignolyticus TaxID=1334193 RepID=A0A806XA39_9ENTR|nr:fimbrial protein [[Enterobacter] lignolyticus]ALR78764.1 fimbrial protein [[Enterobacter] lignolyticus]
MKKILSGLIMLFFCYNCFAAGDGVCHNSDGSTHMLNLAFGPITVSSANNQTGYTVVDALTNTTGTYPVRCHCDDQHGGQPPYSDTTFYPIYYIGDPAPGLILDRAMGGLNYYILKDTSGSETLSVGVKVFIINNQYAAIPFDHLSNQSTSPSHTCGAGNDGSTINLDSGRSAKLSFYLRHPVMGTIDIPQTEVAWLYAGMSDDFPRTTPVSKVTIKGQLIAPQNCEINQGQVIDIDLGKIYASEFSSTPGAVVSGRKIKTDVAVSCTGMSEVRNTAKINASFVAQAPSADASMVTTSNPDVGVKIYDRDGSPVRVDGSSLMPADMSAISLVGNTNGSVTFYSAPASLTGNKPTPNTFDAWATLVIEFSN